MNMMHKPERCRHDRDAESCPECAAGSRNRYYRRKMMTAEDFRAEQDYMIGRRRLINRAIHGWGVVHGLVVKGEDAKPKPTDQAAAPAKPAPRKSLVVGHGLALDKHGRELIVPENHHLCRHDLFVPGGQEQHCKPQELSTLKPGTLVLLSAHYAEHRIDPVRLSDACDCSDHDWNRVCETVVFSLTPVEKCLSAEPACPDDCGCPVDYPSEPKPEPDPSWPRSHHVLCCWSDHAKIAKAGSVCFWRNDTWIDPCHGVPLACVRFVGFEKDDPEKGEPLFDEIKECAPRRIVKRNDLLFDLIRSCDLTRIDYLSWRDWPNLPKENPPKDKDTVYWDVFQSMIVYDVVEYATRTTDGHPWLKDTDWFKDYDPKKPASEDLTKFEIGFSGPVRVNTVKPKAISISGFFPDKDTGWNKVLRFPITRMLYRRPEPGDPDDTTRRVMIFVHHDWVYDEILGNKSEFRVEDDRNYFPFIEIEIFGDLIEDCRGVTVDASTAGSAVVPTGNGTPGGTCRTVFRVTPKPAKPGQTPTA
jgi:hypothetical protein